MKTAAARYDETAPTALGGGQFMLLRSQVIDMIEAAVAEERARCAAIARRRSNHSGLNPIEDIPWQIAEEIERAPEEAERSEAG